MLYRVTADLICDIIHKYYSVLLVIFLLPIFIHSNVKAVDTTEKSLADLEIIANQTTGPLLQVCALCSC